MEDKQTSSEVVFKMSLQDKIFDVAAKLEGTGEGKDFEDIMGAFKELEAEVAQLQGRLQAQKEFKQWPGYRK